jgi:hypothetical protein
MVVFGAENRAVSEGCDSLLNTDFYDLSTMSKLS